MTTSTMTDVRRLTRTLPNGLRVIAERNAIAPAVAVNLWYGVGSRHEEPGRTGLAHLFEHLMFQGSQNVATGEHFATLDALGAQLNATTSQDRTNYFETVPVAALDLALWLEADRMGGLPAALDQVNLDNQRDVVRNERRQRQDNQPYGNAWELLYAAAFPAGHQYHHLPIGSMEDLAAASLDDVRAFFTRHYVPGNAVISLVGDIDPDEAIARVEHYFGGIDAGELPAPRPPQPVEASSTGSRRDIDDEDVPLPAAYLMWSIPQDGTPECDQLALAVHMLAEAGSSRFATELVRRRRIATHVGGGVARQIGGGSALTLMAIGAEKADPQELVEGMLDVLERFAGADPAPHELAAAVATAEADHLWAVSGLAGRADSLSHGQCLFADPDHDENAVQALREIRADQVARAVRRWLTPERAHVLTYRPIDVTAVAPTES